ncbi:lipopolysaccharide biosynthesis protein [Kordiimonas aquimaris]|uniref:lipopolysaccharide biosynthesis protein n=1 Tax=Kordiimonas aquimaris TaxID=707591 RepID=UPI0021D28DCA|nr:hypothetical protein [Kordiimonas aquimaris]
MNPIDDIKDILRGALASLGGFGGRMLARLILMIVAGQLYGAAALGVLGQVAAITEILAAIAVIGLKRKLLDFLSEPSNRATHLTSTVKEAIITTFIVACVMSLLFAAAWPFLFPDITMPFALYFAVPAIAFAEIGGTAIRFKRIIRWEVIARCVMEPWAFLTVSLLYYYGINATGTGLVAAYGFSCIAAAIGISFGLHHAYDLPTLMRAPVNRKNLYLIIKRSWQAGVTDIGVIMFRRLDILILSLLAGHQITGAYYMAQQIVTVPHKIHKLFEPMMAPVIAKLHHAKKPDRIGAKLAGICRWVFMLQLALTVPFAMFAGHILGLFNDVFFTSALVLVILLFAELIDGSFALTETPLIYAKPSVPPRLVAMTLLIEAIAVAGLAVWWGAPGAAAGFFVAMLCLNTMRLFSLKKHMNIRVITVHYLRPITFALIITALLFTAQNLVPVANGYIVGGTVISAIGLFCVMIKFWALSPLDKQVLSELKAHKAVSKQAKLS